MSSSDRRLFLTSLAALAGCGFTPVYAPGGAAEELRGEIAFDEPRDTPGFALVRRLEDRLGRPDAPRYRFAAEITLDEEQAGITPDQVITRYNVLGAVDWTLSEIGEDGPRVAGGRVSNFTSYSATGTPVATQSAQRDATRRLMVILADRIAAELLATAGDWRT